MLNLLLSNSLTVLLVVVTGFYAGCSSNSGGGSSNSTVAQKPYCSTVVIPSNPVTITGSAVYQFRLNGNGPVSGSTKPIRYAEMEVRDSSDQIIQCGSTDGSGNFSINVPTSSSNLVIRVNSRASNDQVKAYVLKSPGTNAYHTIGGTFTPLASGNIGTLTAPATGDLEGGAFNILNQILKANEFLKTNTATCTTISATCTPFTVAPIVYAYWDAGVSPAIYFPGQVGDASFYLPGESQLYLLGGKDGDVDNSDTDHFDNSIVIHEYGHFIEDQYSETDSPGGAHSGNEILDPRLAWGEGWANFFQAAVNGVALYRDTLGTVDGTTLVLFNENLETGTIDIPGSTGEGNFHEFSITRGLLDIYDSNNESGSIDDISSGFNKIWHLVSSESGGIKDSGKHFRSLGLLYDLHSALSSPNEWDTVITAEKQANDRSEYAAPLILGGSCSAISILAVDISGARLENGSFANSNQFASNDFYHYSHNGGTLDIQLNYTTTGSDPGNLDLYLYPEDYTFGDNFVAASRNTISSPTAVGSELINSSFPAGEYMINIHVETQVSKGTSSDYSLQINGQGACP